MGNAAIALAILGFAIGTVFRLRILLSVLALLLVASVAFAISRGSSFLNTALIIMAAQSIVQGSYFLGLVARAVLTAACRTRMRPIL
jgi:hypothetical protein